MFCYCSMQGFTYFCCIPLWMRERRSVSFSVCPSCLKHLGQCSDQFRIVDLLHFKQFIFHLLLFHRRSPLRRFLQTVTLSPSVNPLAASIRAMPSPIVHVLKRLVAPCTRSFIVGLWPTTCDSSRVKLHNFPQSFTYFCCIQKKVLYFSHSLNSAASICRGCLSCPSV